MKVTILTGFNGILHFQPDVYGDNKQRAMQLAKDQLVTMYCNDGCKGKVISSQLEDPSNLGRVYHVEI